MGIDWLCVGIFVALCVLSGQRFLMLHLAAMALRPMPDRVVCGMDHPPGDHWQRLAGRTQRGPLARVAYLMFYHREHHLFPRVPVRNLPVLAARLDRDVAGYKEQRKPVVPLWDHG